MLMYLPIKNFIIINIYYEFIENIFTVNNRTNVYLIKYLRYDNNLLNKIRGNVYDLYIYIYLYIFIYIYFLLYYMYIHILYILYIIIYM